MARFASSTIIYRGILGFGLALFGFAFSRWFVLSLLLLAVVGFCSIAYMTVSQVVLQRLVPDELRGRVMGLWAMTWSLNNIGTALLAAAANFLTAPIALGVSSLFMIAFCILVTGRSSAFRGLGIMARVTPHGAPPAPAGTPTPQTTKAS
jgi:MFS family permease